MRRRRYSDQPINEVLPGLLSQRGLSLRALARAVGVSESHLSRSLRRSESKTFSPDLAERISVALGLERGFFPEARLGYVIRRIREDPALRDRLYRNLAASEP